MKSHPEAPPHDQSQTAQRAPAKAPAKAGIDWRLHILTSPDLELHGAALEIASRATVVGHRPNVQGATCVLVVDPTLSRAHLSLAIQGGDHLVVAGLQTRDGSWPQGVPLQGQRSARDATPSTRRRRSGVRWD